MWICSVSGFPTLSLSAQLCQLRFKFYFYLFCIIFTYGHADDGGKTALQSNKIMSAHIINTSTALQ